MGDRVVILGRGDCIVVLEPGVFLADGDGDPPRTCHMTNAKVFHSPREAEYALFRAREYRRFEDARIFYPTLD